MNTHSANIFKYYIWKFLGGFFFAYTVQAIYLLSRGITMPQLALFQSTILVVTTILEIPTGYIADRYSRKLSVALGFLCAGIGYVGYVFVRDIYTLLPLSLVFALSKALNSGAEESLLYDELKGQSTEATFLKVTTKGGLFSTISAAIASFSGPILYTWHYSSLCAYNG